MMYNLFNRQQSGEKSDIKTPERNNTYLLT